MRFGEPGFADHLAGTTSTPSGKTVLTGGFKGSITLGAQAYVDVEASGVNEDAFLAIFDK